MNIGWVRSCNVAEEAQSVGSQHVGDWLALCHLPEIRICHILCVKECGGSSVNTSSRMSLCVGTAPSLLSRSPHRARLD